MKRFNNLFDKIISIENLELADKIARKGKSKQFSIKLHDKNKRKNIEKLHLLLKEGKFKTSQYSTFTIYEPKERIIFRLDYYPDRILQQAIINILEPIWVNSFSDKTYSCIKKRGIMKAFTNLRENLKDKEETKYCLKFDVRKFYPSISHNILKVIIRRKIKDDKVLTLLDEIIDSSSGVPIGNITSQYFANLYLSQFDHWVIETKEIKYFHRYCDDIVILSSSKEQLHRLFKEIREYLLLNLKLEIKSNYQIYPTDIRGIDFVGYRFFKSHTLLRKSIKQRFKRMMLKYPNKKSISSYKGWISHCNGVNLWNKYV